MQRIDYRPRVLRCNLDFAVAENVAPEQVKWIWVLKKARVLITGGSQGIGEGLAEAFAEEGCDLVLVARSADKLTRIASRLEERHGISVESIAADLTDPSSLRQIDAAGPVDVLVNNAGSIPGGSIDKVESEQWRLGWNLKVLAISTFAGCFSPRWPIVARA